MSPEEGRKERNRYVVYILTLSYTAFALGLILENRIMRWETWTVVFLLLSVIFAWWIHLKQPLTESGRVYVLAAVYYSAVFYQGVHESSLFDVALIMCFIFFLFSLTDELKIFDIGVLLYFSLLAYQSVFHFGWSLIYDPLTLSRVILHTLIVVISSRFAKSNINGRQRSSEEQGRIIRALADMNRRTEDFMANVSHELRTPINAVTGFSAILIERYADPAQEMYDIYRAGHRLSEQVSDILDYTEIDTNRVILSSEPYGIYSVINDVVNVLRESREDTDLDLIIDVEATMPAVLQGDERRLKKMFLHLIDNAFKFTKEGGIYVHVDAEKREYGVNLLIEVSDTGIGIPPEQLHMISRGFYQGDSGRSRSAGGIGLGLSIVYGFVHAMGGFIKMESTPGQGTTVRLTIPQEVIDPAPCMSVTDPDHLSIACYLRAEKYRVPMVRDYYESMISHLVRGLRVPLKRAASIGDLRTIAEQTKPTHIFTAQDEYEEDPAFFLQLSQSIRVIVVADQNFQSAESAGISILRKPFYGFPIAALLNSISIVGGDDPVQAGMSVSFPGCKALVVDDEEMNLVVAKGIFTGYGMEVHTALSGRESINRYEREDFDIIFMDHMMPEMDGVEAMKALKQAARAKNRSTRIVALTANAVSGAREMFLAEGFDGFIPKPIVTAELEHLLRKILPANKIHFEKEKPVVEKEQLNRNQTGQALGIERCLGDRSLYRRLRLIFIEEMTHNLRVFRSAYATGTMEPYIARLRALRDGARILGEDDLTRQAKRLEQAIADLDARRIDKEQELLFALYRECVERMRKAAVEGGDIR